MKKNLKKVIEMFCKNCGSELQGDYCESCGVKSEKEVIKSNKNLNMWEAVALIIGIPVALGWFLGIIGLVVGFVIAILYVNNKWDKKAMKG
jgi:uncharacterized membrane protein YvbJ